MQEGQGLPQLTLVRVPPQVSGSHFVFHTHPSLIFLKFSSSTAAPEVLPLIENSGLCEVTNY